MQLTRPLLFAVAVTAIAACATSEPASSPIGTASRPAASEATILDTTAADTTPTEPATTVVVTTTTTTPHTGDFRICGNVLTLDDPDGDGWGRCIRKVGEPFDIATDTPQFAIDPAATCSWPDNWPVEGQRAYVVCTLVNPDLSEGQVTITLNADKTGSVSEYTITKQAPPSRATCTVEPPTGQIAKGSAPWTGQCVHFFAAVFQFDTNTGPCNFLGNYSSTRENRSYNFDGGVVRVSANTTNCDLLTPVVEDSLVEVWALVQGDESYDTTIGGTNTYTVMQLVDIEIYKQP